jgi:hypothetical protein
MRKQHIRVMAISLFVIVITLFNFSKLTGSDCIRAIHVVNLLICGMGIGLFLTNAIALLRNK